MNTSFIALGEIMSQNMHIFMHMNFDNKPDHHNIKLHNKDKATLGLQHHIQYHKHSLHADVADLTVTSEL